MYRSFVGDYDIIYHGIVVIVKGGR